eukprot:UN31297
MTTPGIMDAPLVFGSATKGDQIVKWRENDDEMTLWSDVADGQRMALCMEITEFHYLLLYANRLIVVNRLNRKCVLVLGPSKFNRPESRYLQMCSNGDVEYYFVITDSYVYQIVEREDEDRDIWKIYLDKQNYVEAKNFAKKSKTETNCNQIRG